MVNLLKFVTDRHFRSNSMFFAKVAQQFIILAFMALVLKFSFNELSSYGSNSTRSTGDQQLGLNALIAIFGLEVLIIFIYLVTIIFKTIFESKSNSKLLQRSDLSVTVRMIEKNMFFKYMKQEEYAILKAKKNGKGQKAKKGKVNKVCLLYTSPSPRDRQKSRMPSSA